MWTNVFEFQMIEVSTKKKKEIKTCASEASRKFWENLHIFNKV